MVSRDHTAGAISTVPETRSRSGPPSGADKGGHRHRTAHALPHKEQRHIGMAFGDDRRHGFQIGDQGLAARPDAGVGRPAKAALVIGVGGDAGIRPHRRSVGKRVGIVVEAVQCDDNRRGLPIRQPAAQRQAIAVRRYDRGGEVGDGGGNAVFGKRITGIADQRRLLHRRPHRLIGRAAPGENQGTEQQAGEPAQQRPPFAPLTPSVGENAVGIS